MTRWRKEEAFPVIKRLIEQLCQQNGFADRDQIAAALLKDIQGSQLVEQASNEILRSPLAKAGNIVDWFSADLTREAKVSVSYGSLYRRERVKRPHPETGRSREVWLYHLAYQVTQSEKLFEEIATDEILVEGAIKSINVNAYERDVKARKQCIDYYGASCVVCGFNFDQFYGFVGKGYIQVHHLKPLSEVREDYEVEPIKDLRPVCANCHVIIHRRKPPYTIAEVKQFIPQLTVTQTDEPR